MSLLKRVWFGVLPTILKMNGHLAMDNTHKHENLPPPSSLSGPLIKTKLNEIYTYLFLVH
jgi:hypothetical protein